VREAPLYWSRHIKKENRVGQVFTQKLLALKVRQLVGVVELRACLQPSHGDYA
jgi:hypothetical protein